MSKKILALILGLVFVLSLCPMTALAEQTASLTLNADGSIATYGKNVDDFEHLNLQPNRKTAYPDSSLGQTSNVFQAKADDSSGEFTIEEAVGGRTGKMLKINPVGYASLYVWKLPLPAGQITRFAFDFYFDKFDQDVAGVRFGGNIGNGVTYDVLKSFVQEKTWYRYVVEIDANQKSRTAFLDADGNIVYCQATRRGPSGGTSGYDYKSGWPVTEGTSDTWINGTEPVIYISTPGKFVVYVDNAEISAYKATEWVAPSLLSSTIADNATEVSSATSEVTLAFDQPLASTTATLTADGGQGVTCTAQLASGIGTKEHVYKLTLPALMADTQYTLALSGFSNGGKACTDTITFKTEDAGISVDRETFESEAVLTYNRYVSEENILRKEPNGSELKTTLVDGYTQGSKALNCAYGTGSATDATQLATAKGYGLPSYMVNGVSKKGSLVATYRIKVEDVGTNPSINLGHLWSSLTPAYIQLKDGTLSVGNIWDGTSTWRTISGDHWYNIVWKMDENGYEFSVVDAEGTGKGNLIYTKNKLWTAEPVSPDADRESLTIYPFYMVKSLAGSGKNVGTSITIDDFAIWSVKPESAKHALSVESSSADNGEFSFTFNQPVLGTANMFKLYAEKDGDSEICYLLPTFKYPDFCAQTIAYTDVDYYTDYKLDYSGLTGVSGAPFGANEETITETFRNESVPEDMAVLGDISCNGLTTGSKLAFNLYSKTAQSPTVIAAFYNRSFPAELSAIEVVEDFGLNAGTNEKEITLTKNINADYVRLYAWDGLTTMKPLMEAYKALTPVSGLKVLMIGSSLSEDVGRYLNQIATAGGATLDLTIKGVGGSRATQHEANLKRELSYGLDKDYSDAKVQAYMDDVASAEIERAEYFCYANGEVKQSYGTGNWKHKVLVSALLEKQYDIISIEYRVESSAPNTMESSLEYLTAKLRELQPDAEIVLYQPWNDFAGTSEFATILGPVTKEMAEKIPSVVSNLTAHGDDMEIVPAGHAFYLAEKFSDWADNRYNQGDGNTNAGIQPGSKDQFNTADGLYRDANHASYYGCYLADAVWYEMLTGKRAPILNASGNAVIDRPTGYVAADTANVFFSISEEEHLARLQFLSDIAHTVCKEQRTK